MRQRAVSLLSFTVCPLSAAPACTLLYQLLGQLLLNDLAVAAVKTKTPLKDAAER
jgi:hypothetical protein